MRSPWEIVDDEKTRLSTATLEFPHILQLRRISSKIVARSLAGVAFYYLVRGKTRCVYAPQNWDEWTQFSTCLYVHMRSSGGGIALREGAQLCILLRAKDTRIPASLWREIFEKNTRMPPLNFWMQPSCWFAALRKRLPSRYHFPKSADLKKSFLFLPPPGLLREKGGRKEQGRIIPHCQLAIRKSDLCSFLWAKLLVAAGPPLFFWKEFLFEFLYCPFLPLSRGEVGAVNLKSSSASSAGLEREKYSYTAPNKTLFPRLEKNGQETWNSVADHPRTL